MNSSSKFTIFFLGIFFLNIFLKFYGIDKNSIWLDEAYSIHEASLSIQDIILHSSQSDNPPLYYILLHYWTNIFGFSELAVRSLSALFSVLAALILFGFVSKSFNLLTGFLSALFFTISNENLFYAQETRTYSLVVFLTTISICVFLNLFKKRNSYLLICLTLVNILLLYSHYLSVLIPILEVGVALLFLKSNNKFFYGILLSGLFVIICFLPWMQFPLSHIPKEGNFWLHKPTFSNFKGILIAFAGNKISLVLCFIVLVIAVYWKYILKKMNFLSFSFEEITLLSLTFLPIIIIYFIGSYAPVFLLRYLLFASVPFYILFPFYLDIIFNNRKVFVLSCLLLIVLSSFSLKLHPTKDENWRGAVEKVKNIKSEDDNVILSASYTNLVFSYYYNRNIFLQNSIDNSMLNSENIFPVKIINSDDFNKFQNKKKLIGVFCHEILDDPEGKLKHELLSNFKITESYEFEKVKVLVFERLLN